MRNQKEGDCQLCERNKPLTFHHLIPKKVHSNKWFRKNFSREQRLFDGIMICRECHDHLHIVFNEKELGRKYNQLVAIKSHPEMNKFIEWIRDR